MNNFHLETQVCDGRWILSDKSDLTDEGAECFAAFFSEAIVTEVKFA